MTDQTDIIPAHRQDDLRVLLAAANPVTTPEPYSSERGAALVRAITSSPPPPATLPVSRRRPRRRLLVGAGLVGAVTLGGVTAVAGLRPAGEVASAPLAPPIILNGIGPAAVPLPAAPKGATYLRIELTCFDGTLCATPGGSVSYDKPSGPMVQRDVLPLTNAVDPSSAQALPPLDVKRGLPVTVDKGTHWRVYAVFTSAFNSTTAELPDGRRLGIPNNMEWPDLVPAVATNGRAGWINYKVLTDQGHPTLTDSGLTQKPIPVYDQDGETILGTADVSRSID